MFINYSFYGSPEAREIMPPDYLSYGDGVVAALIGIHHPSEVNPFTAGNHNPSTGQRFGYLGVLKYYGITLSPYWHCCLEAGRTLGTEDINA
ncbi:hypothetical protein KIF53_15220 [Chromobacterium subtsugae]|uniref:Uncharacterized protein n=1 Tax=Chromobacterium subtsugae TaxID=251747 RepID=A0ABS7FG18_9NEIS|nr:MULTISPECIES: hypothetical protein [Chromobacterium]MBW7567756.1 hypothetical protein [Chromobacterium subtsugae]MBW8288982.1 hypothetical protein [Chromobacterium subtsugae]WSE89546.1 hypothetical protein U6115_11675 [Chromobacterium subtsugae]WVH57917.1 hypothetical protein U6151_11695 [Chromobacterium subtsugae]